MVVGIDLGANNTRACFFVNSRRKRFFTLGGGEKTLPNVIYADKSGKIFVGQRAQSYGATDPSRMIRLVRNHIGNPKFSKKCGEQIFTPTDVATEILKEVQRQIIMQRDDNEIDVAITVPAYFNDNQRDEIRKACAAAGFNFIWILEEPTAAAIEIFHDKQPDKKILVADIGTSTFDLSVLEFDNANDNYRVIAVDGDDRLGGDDFDRAIQQEFIRHVENDTGIKLSDEESTGIDYFEYQRLMHLTLIEARRAKELLSDEEEIFMSDIYPFDFDLLDFGFTRKDFERTCKPLFDRIFNRLNSFVNNNENFKLQDIGHVILTGGTFSIPHIRKRIERDLGIKPANNINDEDFPSNQLAVSGAARFAEMKSAQRRENFMVVGIDLGTTNTLACYFVNGRKKLLKFAGGATMLPSVIYTDENNKVIVGQPAQSRGVMEPSRMIRSAKTYIGNFELDKKWKCGERTYTPTDVATEVLKEVRRRLIQNMRLDDNEKIDAVITVPAYFNDNQRDETRKAGTAAGFNVMWILEEPTAAAIEAVHAKQLDKKVFVVDIGGGTFDLSVLEADHANHTYRAIAIDGDDRLGGDDFDRAIQKEFIRHIEDDAGIKLSDAKSAGLDDFDYNRLMNRLLIEARRAKEELSGDTECKVIIPNLTTLGGQNYDLNFVFTRKAFERACKPLFDRIFNQLNAFVKDNKNFKPQDIGHVILAGGTCFIPYIKERIEKDLGIKPDDDLPLSQLVVSGAARVAEAKSGGVESGGINLESILAHSLGIEVLGNDGKKLIFDRILAKDTPYSKCSVVKEYVTTFDNQTQIDVNVYEAGTEGATDLNFHRFRGSLILKNLPPAPKGKSKVRVKFDYTENQQLKVTVTDSQDESNYKEALIDKTTKTAIHESTEPIDMVLMLDSSGSMLGNEMIEAKNACRKLITEMIDLSVHKLSLMSFDSSPHMFCHLTDNTDALTKKLMEIEACGSTEMVSALRTAYNEVEHSTRQKIALLVTDGYPDDKDRTISYAKKLRDKGLKIIAIGVGKGFDKNFLNKMVGEKNSFTIKNMSELTATFERVINALTKGNL